MLYFFLGIHMENQINVGNQNSQQVGQNQINQPTPENKRWKANFWLISTFILFMILILGAIFVFFETKRQGSVFNRSQTTRVTPSPPITTSAPIFPIKVFDEAMDSERLDLTKGEPAPCQPDFFDPKVNKFYKVKQNGTPSELYKIQGFQGDIEGGTMMIDGWDKEGEDKVNLPSPYDVTVYNFGCASSFSNVLDLSKNGVRQALYTHVLHYSFSKDGKLLFLVNNINDQGNWTRHKRIINIETKEINELPNVKCVSELDGFWQGDRLVTYTENRDLSDYQTDVCIWDKSAKLISRVGATTAWGAASRDFLAEKIGLLPTQPNIFYAYTSKNENTCSLFFVDITKNDVSKSIDILDKRNYSQSYYYCVSPEVEFDFSGLYFDRGILKYRIEKDKHSSGQTIWGDWQTTSLK